MTETLVAMATYDHDLLAWHVRDSRGETLEIIREAGNLADGAVYAMSRARCLTQEQHAESRVRATLEITDDGPYLIQCYARPAAPAVPHPAASQLRRLADLLDAGEQIPALHVQVTIHPYTIHPDSQRQAVERIATALHLGAVDSVTASGRITTTSVAVIAGMMVKVQGSQWAGDAA
jgi:hypothetical protein